MKKIFLIILAYTLVIFITSCENAPQSTSLNESTSKLSEPIITSQSTSSIADTTEKTEPSQSELFSDVSDYTIDDPVTYVSDDAHFTVQYPKDWDIEPVPYVPATEGDDGSLMWGVKIYIDGSENSNEFIFVYEGQGPASNYVKYPRQDFITSNMTRGKLSYEIVNVADGEYDIAICFNDYFLNGVLARISEAHFTAYKSQILGVLKSIEISGFETGNTK